VSGNSEGKSRSHAHRAHCTEFEGKILDIDPETNEWLILDKGGQKLGEKFMRRYVYDIMPGDQAKWIRLRDTGDETTLTIEEITSDGIAGLPPEVLPGDQANQLHPRRRTGRNRHVAADPAPTWRLNPHPRRGGQGCRSAWLRRS
jgi:hypothetical protein